MSATGIAEIFIPARKKNHAAVAHQRRGNESDAGCWPEIADRLQTVDTGIILNSDPFIYNFFEFDKLPWSGKILRELVVLEAAKIFPENIAAYDHQFFV